MSALSGEEKIYHKGDVLYVKGDPSDYLYLVAEGEVVIFSEESKKISAVNIVGEKDFAGEQSLFAEEKRHYTAIASKRTKVIPIEKENIKRVLKTCPHWVSDIMKLLGERLLSTNGALAEHNIVSEVDIALSKEDVKLYSDAVAEYRKGS